MAYVTKLDEDRKLCLECGEVLPYGRTDKMYCSVKCKNRHYYAAHQSVRYVRTRVASILDKNYALLEEVLEAKEDSADLAALTVKGFNPDYMTYHRSRRYYSECGCYDIRYRLNCSRIYCVEKI